MEKTKRSAVKLFSDSIRVHICIPTHTHTMTNHTNSIRCDCLVGVDSSSDAVESHPKITLCIRKSKIRCSSIIVKEQPSQRLKQEK